MKQTILGSIIGLALALGLITVIEIMSPGPAQSQSVLKSHGANTFGDLTTISLNVTPEDNPTNVATFWDNTGTNYFRINPTNTSMIQMQITNTLFTGVSTNLAAITNGAIHGLKFINGLLYNVN